MCIEIHTIYRYTNCDINFKNIFLSELKKLVIKHDLVFSSIAEQHNIGHRMCQQTRRWPAMLGEGMF